RAGAWKSWARQTGIQPFHGPLPAGAAPACILLAVPESGIPAAALRLAGELAPSRRVRFAAHLSGLAGLESLGPLGRLGFRIAALHPLVPFGRPRASLEALQGAPVTVLAGPGAARASARVVRLWGGRPWPLDPRLDRRRYHLGLVLAANHLAALLGWSEELLRPAFGEHAGEMAARLAGEALQGVRRTGAAEALTGPVVRGELAVLEAHFRSLRADERRRYAGLIEPVLDLARRSGRLSPGKAREIENLLAAWRSPGSSGGGKKP
ncbi:MAG: DUF2520 domain-containing protein, partial [Planctomycetota bacterium]